MEPRAAIQLSVAGLKPGHRALESANDEFLEDARRVKEVRLTEPGPAPPGSKGPDTAVWIALTGPAATAALVQIVRGWLGRDRHRSVTVRVQREGAEPATVKVDGENISLETLHEALNSAYDDTRANDTRANDTGAH
jgi:hypothetical protein